jgi:hypothetical protein
MYYEIDFFNSGNEQFNHYNSIQTSIKESNNINVACSVAGKKMLENICFKFELMMTLSYLIIFI